MKDKLNESEGCLGLLLVLALVAIYFLTQL